MGGARRTYTTWSLTLAHTLARLSEERDSPEEAVLVRPRRVCARPRVGRALVQLEDAGVHGSSDV